MVSRDLSPSDCAVTSGQSHTPGPWEWVIRDGERQFLKGDGLYVLSPEAVSDDDRVHVDTSVDVFDANARLIAAAPELLEAAKEFQRATQDRLNRSFVEAAFDPTDWRRAERDLLAAIAKAEGRS